MELDMTGIKNVQPDANGEVVFDMTHEKVKKKEVRIYSELDGSPP